FQALQQQPEAVALPDENLHPVGSAVTKHVQRAPERIELKRLLDQRRQPVDALPEVHRLAVNIDLQRRIEPEHQRRPISASITLRISFASVASQQSSSATPLGSRARSLGAIAAIGKCPATSCVSGSFTSANADSPDPARSSLRSARALAFNISRAAYSV